MTGLDATVAVIGVGYEGKRSIMTRMADLGVRLVLVDEPGHWSGALVEDGVAEHWLEAQVTGDPDRDAAVVLEALDRAGVSPDGVLTFYEDSVATAARVAAALGLPGNPIPAVDAARSKVRTRELSAELGLPTPRATRVRSLDELFAAASTIGFPAVVKPEFGASAMGCVRVDDIESLPGVYSLVRGVVDPVHDGIFRMGNDLLLEEYLDGVEFDVDLVMHEGACVFTSVSQNWPTAEPSFQETGLHLPPDHDRRAVERLVNLAVETARGFGLTRGVLHVEGKCTSRGPRLVEVNARLGGGRIHEMVRAVWGVDLVEAQVRSCLDLPPNLRASKKPRCAVVDAFVYAPASGRLTGSGLRDEEPAGCLDFHLDVQATPGDDVDGPDRVFATLLAEVVVVAKDLKRARKLQQAAVAGPPTVASP
jgi:carnosine synthase